jgi:Predicted membrane protein (DUF2339)
VATVFALAFYGQFAAAESRGVWWLAQLLAPLGMAVIWNQRTGAFPFELLIAAGGLAVAELRRRAEAPIWTLACYWLSYWEWSSAGSGGPEAPFAWLSAAFLLFFLWAPWWAVARRRELRAADLLVIVSGPVAFFASSYHLLNPAYHAYMGLLALAVGGLHLVLARLLWPSERAPSAGGARQMGPAMLSVAVACAFAILAVPIQFAGFRVTIAWALEGAALAWLGAKFRRSESAYAAVVVFTLVLVRLFAIDTWTYSDGSQFPALVNPRFLTFAVSAGCLWLCAYFAGSRGAAGTEGPQAGRATLGVRATRVAAAVAYLCGHFVMLWILGLEVAGWVDRNVSATDQASVKTVAISVLMGLYAVMLVTLGVAARAAIHRVAGLALVGVVVGKLYLIDVWELSRVFRIAAFLALGVLLLVVSYLYSRFRPSIEKLLRGGSAE